jgi:hypothetical protein
MSKCNFDDCEQYHCPRCGGHTLGWLDTFQMCSTCELEEEAKMKKKLFIRYFDHKDGIPANSEVLITPTSTADEGKLTQYTVDLVHLVLDWMNAHPEGKVDFVWL